MLVAIIILSILLLLSLIVIIMIGIDDKWHTVDWAATLLFIFLLPVWLVIKIIITLKQKRKR